MSMAAHVPHEAAAAAPSSSAQAEGLAAVITVTTASASVVVPSLSNTVEAGSFVSSAVVESNVQMRQEADSVSGYQESGGGTAGDEGSKCSVFPVRESDCLLTVASTTVVSSACSTSGGSTSNCGQRGGTDSRKVQPQGLSSAGTSSLAMTLASCSAQERMQRLLELKKALDRFREDDVAEKSSVRNASAAADADVGQLQTAGRDHASSNCTADDLKCLRPTHTPDVLGIFALLGQVDMNREILSKTRIGVSVGKLRSHPNPQVRSRASELITKWKACIAPAAASTAADAQSYGTGLASAAAATCVDVAGVTRSSPKELNNAACGVFGFVPHEKSYDDLGVASNTSSPSKVGKATRLSTATGQGNPRPAPQASNGGGDGDRRGSGAKGTASPANASWEFPGPLTGDSVRDRARGFLWKALLDGMHKQHTWSRVASAGGAGSTGRVPTGGETAAQVAAQVEEALWEEYCERRRSTREYTAQLKTLKWNFADPKNPDLNLKVLCGVFTPEQLATMTSAELASDEKKRLREQQKKESMEACQSDWEMKKLMQGAGADGQFPCFKCRTTKTVYFQMQTRSSDEPMTTFVTCLECGNRWKF